MGDHNSADQDFENYTLSVVVEELREQNRWIDEQIAGIRKEMKENMEHWSKMHQAETEKMYDLFLMERNDRNIVIQLLKELRRIANEGQAEDNKTLDDIIRCGEKLRRAQKSKIKQNQHDEQGMKDVESPKAENQVLQHKSLRMQEESLRQEMLKDKKMQMEDMQGDMRGDFDHWRVQQRREHQESERDKTPKKRKSKYGFFKLFSKSKKMTSNAIKKLKCSYTVIEKIYLYIKEKCNIRRKQETLRKETQTDQLEKLMQLMMHMRRGENENSHDEKTHKETENREVRYTEEGAHRIVNRRKEEEDEMVSNQEEEMRKMQEEFEDMRWQTEMEKRKREKWRKMKAEEERQGKEDEATWQKEEWKRKREKLRKMMEEEKKRNLEEEDEEMRWQMEEKREKDQLRRMKEEEKKRQIGENERWQEDEENRKRDTLRKIRYKEQKRQEGENQKRWQEQEKRKQENVRKVNKEEKKKQGDAVEDMKWQMDDEGRREREKRRKVMKEEDEKRQEEGTEERKWQMEDEKRKREKGRKVEMEEKKRQGKEIMDMRWQIEDEKRRERENRKKMMEEEKKRQEEDNGEKRKECEERGKIKEEENGTRWQMKEEKRQEHAEKKKETHAKEGKRDSETSSSDLWDIDEIKLFLANRNAKQAEKDENDRSSHLISEIEDEFLTFERQEKSKKERVMGGDTKKGGDEISDIDFSSLSDSKSEDEMLSSRRKQREETEEEYT